jgi:hypothetical protein
MFLHHVSGRKKKYMILWYGLVTRGRYLQLQRRAPGGKSDSQLWRLRQDYELYRNLPVGNTGGGLCFEYHAIFLNEQTSDFYERELKTNTFVPGSRNSRVESVYSLLLTKNYTGEKTKLRGLSPRTN